jgi:pimeloyl-ACP methyl ester carboxylesterase
MLRGRGLDDAWSRITANVFRLDEVAPHVRDFVLATSRPRQDVVLGYWQDLFERTPQELDALVAQGAASLRASGLPYVAVVGQDPAPEDVAWTGSNMPAARTEVWPQSGHFPHLAHPRRFAELLKETGTWSGNSMAAPAVRTEAAPASNR